jgi:hypothetical protein
VPPEHVGGIEHCLAVCARDTELPKVAEDSDALVMRFSNQAQVLGISAPGTTSHHAAICSHTG